jgi:hypothetical protein
MNRGIASQLAGPLSDPCSTIECVRVAVVPGAESAGLLCQLGSGGVPDGPVERVADLAAAIAERDRRDQVRWVWPATAACYPPLLRAGVRVARIHDVALTEALLLGSEGRPDESSSLAAAAARLADGPLHLPPDRPPRPAQDARFDQDLDEASGPAAEQTMAALTAVHADQLRRIAASDHVGRFSLLVAAESAGGLAAAEMTAAGLPWRADIHDALLTDALGSRPPATAGPQLRPPRLAELTAQISAALGATRPVNPDSPAQLLRALSAGGVRVSSTRSAELRKVEHPAIPLLLEYKELSRLYAAYGWTWLDSWVAGGRFRPEYLVGGVVSGRWASRGGGALQIPKLLRRAVVADPGWVLVVADAAQLEPRVLAALAGDKAFAAAAASGDVYAALAGAFDGDRGKAKVALLSAMYGGAGGEAGQLLAVLRRRFPAASSFVESAARAGQEGRVVRSVLGRTCPPPSARWRALTGEADADGEQEAGQASRARGRFTRNFVVQASAADWALVLIAGLRPLLASLAADGERPAELVFFQHDEVIVHCRAGQAEAVTAAISEAAAQATKLIFGGTQVTFPMTAAVVACYADAK